MTDQIDLKIRAGRVVCPGSGLDTRGEVAVRGERIAYVGSLPSGNAPIQLDFPEGILLPGLIDLHAHPARSGSRWGVDPDRHCLARGTTTVLSQGDAGADFCDDYVRETIEGSRTRVKLALNLSATGEAGPGGCFERLESIDLPRCLAAVERHREHIWGLSVNLSHHCCGQTDPHEVLRRGLEAATQANLRLLIGLRRPDDWPLADQLKRLRPGDVVTYCYRRAPHCIVEAGRVLPCVREARAAGVLFDVGHGTASFAFEVAEAAIADGFVPDTISTDLQRGHIGQTPVHDLPLVMSKLRAAGMTEADLFACVTATPARILGLTRQTGMLRPGLAADMVVLQWSPAPVPLFDAHGQTRMGQLLEPVATVRRGTLVRPCEAAS
ncbi:MAG: amidohydrolase family protein [Planctomycetales bacterium]